MREILFRGKRIDNGEWVTGTPFIFGDRCKMIQAVAIHPDFVDDGNVYYSEGFPVDPDTVGQYTGLTAKGKKIFEGDIVEGHCHSAWSHRLQRCEVAYGRDGFEARNHIDGLGGDYYTYRVLFSKDVQVIGNIHDNPELLKGK